MGVALNLVDRGLVACRLGSNFGAVPITTDRDADERTDHPGSHGDTHCGSNTDADPGTDGYPRADGHGGTHGEFDANHPADADGRYPNLYSQSLADQHNHRGRGNTR